ncbi:hypothetical protein EV697_10827 [Bisgaardia hudsonensis]|uniref:Lipoprotein n=1 Tax=Bisgaardia hudsonensis TaxID=109472 RepID=A0A4R2MRD5_9PAST|nr:hypothetical protein [Bisgaardia hudsonensis]QLB12890.1 hypothetical protein A6A11_04335 [Bisgaardia hudsonensis]TCP11304.1 hypothetical protein EV697_10827 [Bisgaardia hudsonensis]
MKPLLLLSLTLVLSGCYLANGSPSQTNFWIKNGKVVPYTDINTCKINANNILGERYIYLLDKFDNDYMVFRNNTQEYQEFSKYTEKQSILINECLYQKGYRFNAPLYWCLAQDGDNTRTCIENMKYRK